MQTPTKVVGVASWVLLGCLGRQTNYTARNARVAPVRATNVSYLFVGPCPTISRLVRDYLAVRRPSGPYRVPLPDAVVQEVRP